MRSWRLKPEPDPEVLQVLSKDLGLSPLTIRLCYQRGFEDRASIEQFLYPKLDQLPSPFTIRDLDKGVARLVRALEQKERVLVYGDYDVDGTTGAALLTTVLRDLGFDVETVQPDRFADGYGVHAHLLEAAIARGVSVVVSVDCGITAFQAADRMVELGVDLIVVDHHQIDPEKGLPKAYAVIDPQRSDCESGLKQLCGCGLAFFVMMGLRARLRAEGKLADAAIPNLKQHLDLVVIATAADMVPLTGVNRVLVRHGLEVLRETRKPGLRALLDVAGLSRKSLSPGSLGFVLGPRINASGRLQSASHALELLISKDPQAAILLAQKLEALNRERSEIQNGIWDEVRKEVEDKIAGGAFQNAIVVANSEWHEGVVGIVASRVTEHFKRPAIVLSKRENDVKGSVRSWGGVDVLRAVQSCRDFLKSFGGHPYAAGVSLLHDQFENLVNGFDRAVGELRREGPAAEAPLELEKWLKSDDLNERVLAELEMLGPFGPGNPEPVFGLAAAVADRRTLKGRHLKLTLSPVGAPKKIDAIWFYGAEKKHASRVTDVPLSSSGNDTNSISWAGTPELNRFQGRVTPSFRVKDLLE